MAGRQEDAGVHRLVKRILVRMKADVDVLSSHAWFKGVSRGGAGVRIGIAGEMERSIFGLTHY